MEQQPEGRVRQVERSWADVDTSLLIFQQEFGARTPSLTHPGHLQWAKGQTQCALSG